MNIVRKIIGNITNLIWCAWSNFRHPCSSDVELKEEDKVYSYLDVKSLAYRLKKVFEYKSDGVSDLWDSVVSPPECYNKAKNGLLEDDCDGFHSALYHCLKKSNLEAYLLCVNAKKSGHCLVVVKIKDKWHICDYTAVYKGQDTLQEAIDEYIKIFPNKYDAKSEVYYYGLIEFDYEKLKFYLKNI